MGHEYFNGLKAKVGKAKQFEKETFEGLPTYENFIYQYGGAFTVNQGNGAELQLTLPPGNFEIEAIVRLYNNSDDRVVYTGELEFYLEDNLRELWEGGELSSTVHSKPYIMQFKTMSTFKTSKVIKFKMGTNATFGGLASQPVIMARRIGAIRFVND